MAVFQHAIAGGEFPSGISQGFQSTFWSLDVGLADVEVIHMNTAFLGSVCKRNKFADCRLRQSHTFVGYLWHKWLVLNKKPSNASIRRLL
jgi:hypothetical protein